jgi:hypothetical protein
MSAYILLLPKFLIAESLSILCFNQRAECKRYMGHKLSEISAHLPPSISVTLKTFVGVTPLLIVHVYVIKSSLVTVLKIRYSPIIRPPSL